MHIDLTHPQQMALGAARRQARHVRQWRRYRAIEWLAGGQAAAAVAATLGCSLASVYNWGAAWRQGGLEGLQEGPHPGRARALDARAEQYVEQVLADDPQQHGYQTTGWTVPLLHAALTHAGYQVSARTVRRTVRRLGWRWKRPKYVLGRPDPDYEGKKGR
jgi:transposase